MKTTSLFTTTSAIVFIVLTTFAVLTYLEAEGVRTIFAGVIIVAGALLLISAILLRSLIDRIG